MNQLWQLTIDDYIEICKRAKANGKKPGDSMLQELTEYVKEKSIQPVGATELTNEELIKEYESKGLKVGEIKDGKIVRRKKDDQEL